MAILAIKNLFWGFLAQRKAAWRKTNLTQPHYIVLRSWKYCLFRQRLKELFNFFSSHYGFQLPDNTSMAWMVHSELHHCYRILPKAALFTDKMLPFQFGRDSPSSLVWFEPRFLGAIADVKFDHIQKLSEPRFQTNQFLVPKRKCVTSNIQVFLRCARLGVASGCMSDFSVS
jgi:hypothetical protein